MPELPNPVHIAILSAVFAVIAFIVQLGQRLGDWKSPKFAKVLLGMAVLLIACWVYLALLLIVKVDVRVMFSNQPTAFWVVMGTVSLMGLVVALPWRILRTSQTPSSTDSSVQSDLPVNHNAAAAHHEARADVFKREVDSLKLELKEKQVEIERLNQHIKDILGGAIDSHRILVEREHADKLRQLEGHSDPINLPTPREVEVQLETQPQIEPVTIDGWSYYSLRVLNRLWKLNRSLYGMTATLTYTGPDGTQYNPVRGLFRNREHGNSSQCETEITKLSPGDQFVDLILVVRSSAPMTDAEQGYEKLWSCSEYPPAILNAITIGQGEWKCEVSLSWQGGKTEQTVLIQVQRYRHANLVVT